MSYRFTRDEPVPEGVRRIVREEVSFATESLKLKKAGERDLAIHEVRKGVKRVRGLLKLLRPVLGDAYIAEDRAWRDLGRRLSAFRDAGVMVGAFDELRASCPKRLYGPVRRRLAGNKQTLSHDVAGAITAVATGLKRAETRLKQWRVQGEGFQAIAPGLKRTYRQGLRALQEAETDPAPDNLHELRRRAKEHLYQLRLLEGVWDAKLRRHEAKVRRLEEMLGSHHNLAVLKTKILEQPAEAGTAKDLEAFLAVLDEMEQDLAEGALKLGARVYKDSSADVTKHVKRLWQNWTA